MKIFNSPVICLVLRLYLAVALLTATIMSPLVFSFIPLGLLVWYLFLWRWPVSSLISLLTEYFMFFATGLLFSSFMGPFVALIFALPITVNVNYRMMEGAGAIECLDSRYTHRPTPIFLTLLIIALTTLGFSILFNSIVLTLLSATAVVLFILLTLYVLREMPVKPILEHQVRERIVAGFQAEQPIKLTTASKIGGYVFLKSPYEWLKVNPSMFALGQADLHAQVSFSPSLSGPSIIELNGFSLDPWGIIQSGFKIQPVVLTVVPRAQYAAWLAQKYLAGTKPGSLPMMSSLRTLKPMNGLRRGVEYYGSREYQPGDSLKNIDWKHSLRFNELIAREYTEFHIQSAVILVNLAVTDAEEADNLSFNVIITALSLAREGVPAALAVYDHREVKLTTTTLLPRELLIKSLKIIQDIVTIAIPVRYLDPPDVARLAANLNHIRLVENGPAQALSRLLEMEYNTLSANAKSNPSTLALKEVFSKVDKASNIVVISQSNHDSEALSFNRYFYKRKGNSVIEI